ncbi:MAG: hypothetical protein M3N08_01790 [Pseudomonadota bacterium]|nr:hypothetical protein [Pseudomonadota bacterium]
MAKKLDYDGYVVRFATPEDSRDVLDFYKDDEKRTPAVYLRKEELIREQIERGLFLIVKNKHDRIIAASAIYPLADGQKIDCVAENGRVTEKGRAVELGSVLRWGDTPNEHNSLPRGFWHPLLIGLLMVEVFRRADADIEADLLIGTIQTDRTQNIRRLTGRAPMSPFEWELFEPTVALQKASGETTEDENIQRRKQHFRGRVMDLPRIASYLMNAHKKGYIENQWGEKLGIDTSELPHATLEAIINNKNFFALPKKIGADPYHQRDNRSWSGEARRFRERIPKPRNKPPIPNATSLAPPPTDKKDAMPARPNTLGGLFRQQLALE